MRWLIYIAIALTFYGSIDSVNSAEIKRVGPSTITFEGTITMSDVLQLYVILKDGDTIEANSPGGNANAGIALYNVLRKRVGITVVVVNRCASACSTMALGAERIIGSLGFHRAYIPKKETLVDNFSLASTMMLDKIQGQMDEIWAKHLAEKQIVAINKHSSPSKIVNIEVKK